MFKKVCGCIEKCVLTSLCASISCLAKKPIRIPPFTFIILGSMLGVELREHLGIELTLIVANAYIRTVLTVHKLTYDWHT